VGEKAAAEGELRGRSQESWARSARWLAEGQFDGQWKRSAGVRAGESEFSWR
jgi:hypothetical protein